jgi:hypothetical protein
VGIPLLRLPASTILPAASLSVSISGPCGSTPSIYSDLAIPSEGAPSERPSVIVTDDVNCLLQYLYSLEGDRQRGNQGIHDHLGELQNELRDLADYMHGKEAPEVVPPPVELKDRSVGESSVVSWCEPHSAPEYPNLQSLPL